MLFTQDIRKRLEVTKNALFSICREREREREREGERERERERERENMFWVFGSRFVRQAEKCLVLFSLSKDYLGS